MFSSLLNSQAGHHLPTLPGRDLYNGNISSWQMGTLASDDSWMRTGFQYAYDKLNRIRSMCPALLATLQPHSMRIL